MDRELVVNEKAAEKLVEKGWVVVDYKMVNSTLKVVLRKAS